MKTFKQFVKEVLSHPDYSGEPMDGDMMLGDLSDDAVIERLNAYVGAYR